jgi:hypothetical protein
MAIRLSRRTMLKTSGAAVGAVGVVSLAGTDAEAIPAKQGSARIAQVVRHSGDRATVTVLASGAEMSVPVKDFPLGWRLRAGDRVLVTGPDFPVDPSTVIPLNHRVIGRLEAVTARGGESSGARLAGTDVVLRPETEWDPAVTRAGSGYVAHCVENGIDETLTCFRLELAR